MPRIVPIPIKQWPSEMRDVIAAMIPPAPRHPLPGSPERPMEGKPKARNNLATFAHHPELARAFFTFNGHILFGTTLSERHRELLVLRVATLRKSGYEWLQHVFVGRDAGLTDEEIARISFGPDAPYWDPLETALLRSADELIGEGVISDETWATLESELSTQQIIDVIFTVGAYEIVAWWFRSLAIEIDDDIRQYLDAPD